MPKVFREDGTFYYYYYNKKKGRKKKRGPKKKLIKGEKIYENKWDFKLLKFSFNKQTEYIGKYQTLEKLNEKRQELESINNSIEFPVRNINNRRKSKQLYSPKDEYVILKRIKGDNDSNESYLHNDYGRLTKYVTTSKNWYIYDIFKCEKEETFWVYGYNPRTDRKTIRWIYINYIDDFLNVSNDYLTIYLYNNKVIFRYTETDIEFVICKNISDAIKVYNFLQEKYTNNKQIIFAGITSKYQYRASATINLLKEKTGWSLQKIYKTTTT